MFCKNAHLGRAWVPETQWVARYAGGLQLPFIAVAQTLWYCGPPYLPFRTHGLSRLFFVNNENKEVKLSKVFVLIVIRLIDGMTDVFIWQVRALKSDFPEAKSSWYWQGPQSFEMLFHECSGGTGYIYNAKRNK